MIRIGDNNDCGARVLLKQDMVYSSKEEIFCSPYVD
jgi:hypothetical protein